MRGRRILTALPIAILGAALAATITRPASAPAFVAASLAGALLAGGAAAIVAGQRLLVIFLAELVVVMVGGPLTAGLVVGVQAFVEGKGGIGAVLISPIVFGALGIVFGAFITIPVGVAFAGLCTGWAAIARRLTS